MKTILAGLLLFAFACVCQAATEIETSSVAVQNIDIWKSDDGGILVFIKTNKADLKQGDVIPLASEVELVDDDGTETRTMPLLSVVLPMPLSIEDGKREIKKGFLEAMYWWQSESKNGTYTSVQFLVENTPEIRWDYWIVEDWAVVALLPEQTSESAKQPSKE